MYGKDGYFFPMFQSLLDSDEFTIPCAPYEGVVGQVLSSLQLIDPTDVDWYSSKLSIGSTQVVDLMSGSGRLAVLASQKGHRVTAIDSSPDVLALNQCDDQNVTFILGDAINAGETSDGVSAKFVTCGGKSFSLLSKPNRHLLYSTVRDILRKGGYFLGDAYSHFSSKTTISNIIPLNLPAGRLLWTEARTYPTSSTMVTNFLLESNNLIGDSRYRMLSCQKHWGISPRLLAQELAEYDLEIEEIAEDSTPGDASLNYYRFVAKAI